MQFILLNCTPKLLAMGIDPSTPTWQDQLKTKLDSYMSVDGWSYDYVLDTLVITPKLGTTVSLNITDFGDAGGVNL